LATTSRKRCSRSTNPHSLMPSGSSSLPKLAPCSSARH
jgi:hypothetical protein